MDLWTMIYSGPVRNIICIILMLKAALNFISVQLVRCPKFRQG